MDTKRFDERPCHLRLRPDQRTESKLAGVADGPVTVRAAPPRRHLARVNAWFAVKVTNGIGTMWCAYAFAALAIVSLPAAVVRSSKAGEGGRAGVTRSVRPPATVAGQ